MTTDEHMSRIYDLITPFNKKGITLSPETSFSVDLELDSLTVMDLVAEIEDEFDIILPLNLLPELETIQHVADAALRLQGGGA